MLFTSEFHQPPNAVAVGSKVSATMKFSRLASWLTRAAVVFLLVCICLLFTAAAIELKHAPHNDGDEDGAVIAHATLDFC